MDLRKFKEKPIMGILRGAKFSQIEHIIESVISNGLETLEITMNTKDAPLLIKKTVEIANGHLMVGAGTVLDMKSLKTAISAGATFIVMPIIVEDVIKYCVKNDIPVFPGALTTNEIYKAWQLKAAMVKIFPAKVLGPEYFMEVKGPFNDMKLLACSGVSPQNMKDYFLNGADAVSFGGSVFRQEWLEKEDFKSIGKAVKNYITAWENLN